MALTEHEHLHGVSEITKEQAASVHKDLPPGGHWVTMRGHHVYIKGDKVIAGSFGDIKSGKVKKGTKGHISDWQLQHDMQQASAARKAEEAKTPKKTTKEKAAAAKTEKPAKPKLPGATPKGLAVIDHVLQKWQVAMHNHFEKIADRFEKMGKEDIPLTAKNIGELMTNHAFKKNTPMYTPEQAAQIEKEIAAGGKNAYSKTAGRGAGDLVALLRSQRVRHAEERMTKTDRNWRDLYRYQPKQFTQQVSEEAANKKASLLETVASTAGKVQDASGLHIGEAGEINGHIIGEDGSTYSVKSFGAGGHTTQKYHIRLKITKLKNKPDPTPPKKSAPKASAKKTAAAKKEPAAKPAPKAKKAAATPKEKPTNAKTSKTRTAKAAPSAEPAAAKPAAKRTAAKTKPVPADNPVKAAAKKTTTKAVPKAKTTNKKAEPPAAKTPAASKAKKGADEGGEKAKSPARSRKPAGKPDAVPVIDTTKPAPARRRAGAKAAGPDTGAVAADAAKPARAKKAPAKPKAADKTEAVVKPARSKKTAAADKVADVRSEGQKGRAVSYDVGEELAGARKHEENMREGFIKKPSLDNLDKLEKISARAARKAVAKDNMLPKGEDALRKEYNAGTDLPTYLLKQAIYGRVAARPDDSPEARRQYVAALQRLQAVLEPVRKAHDLKAVMDDMGNWLTHDHDALQKEAANLRERIKHPAKASDMVKPEYLPKGAIWDAQDQADRRNRIVENRLKQVEDRLETAKRGVGLNFKALGSSFENFFTDQKSLDSTVSRVNAKAKELGNNWDGILSPDDKKTLTAPKEKKNKIKWEREMPEQLQRKGGRKTPVAKPEDAVKAFGFRGVQFGHWVDDASGRYHLEKASEAFHDLADTLGLKDQDVSMNGRLGMAFGARGKGGALAHYEPENKVINLTKEGGAGSLAHEWGHAMDNLLWEHSHDFKRGQLGMASADESGSRMDPKVKAAYDELHTAMHEGDAFDEIERNGTDPMITYEQRRHYIASGKDPAAAIKFHLEEAADKLQRHRERLVRMGYKLDDPKDAGYKSLQKETRAYAKTIKEAPQAILKLHEITTGEKSGPVKVPNGKSWFRTIAEDNDFKDGYLGSPHEMFARAFESYVEDKLHDSGRRNDYLVTGTKKGSVGKGNSSSDRALYQASRMHMIYPQGDERKKINAAMDKLMGAVRSSKSITKALQMELRKSFAKLLGPLFAESLANALPNKMTEEERRILGQSSIDHYMRTQQYLTEQDYIDRLNAMRAAGTDIVSANTERSAYTIDHETDPSEVIYIPVNRLKMVYQTDAATDWDKVDSNMERMQAGEGLKPVEIGYDYDIHDGHHRWLASKAQDYTHVPCIVKGRDEAVRQDAVAQYRSLWKSFQEYRPGGTDAYEGCVSFYLDGLKQGQEPEEAWNEMVDHFDLGEQEQQACRRALEHDLKHLQKSWNEAEHPRDADGRFGTGGVHEPLEIFHGTALVSAEKIKEKGFKAQWSGNGDMGKCAYFKSPKWDHLEDDDFGKTARLVNDFAEDGGEKKKSPPAVIQAVIPREHLLDCSKGRPAELQAMIDATRYAGHPDGVPTWDKKASPYEAYAKKHGIKAIIDRLDTDWADEGWQLGVYDVRIIQVVKIGKQVTGEGDSLTLQKSPAEMPYCLVHHEFDQDGNLVLHVGASEV